MVAPGSDSCNSRKRVEPAVSDHVSRFDTLRRMLGRCYDIDFPSPTVSTDAAGLSQFRQWLSALLERRSHPWRRLLKDRRVRMSVAMSLFLFRKTLPSKPIDIRKVVDRFDSPSPPCDPDFLEFAEGKVRKIFPVGFDVRYPNRCLNWTLNTSACEEYKAKDGGCRGYFRFLREQEQEDRTNLVTSVLAGSSCSDRVRSRFCIVRTPGKDRAVTIPEFKLGMLKPLHSTIYDQLSRQPWLLRGDAKVSAFLDFVRSPGEVFVSGDYESATDNLNGNVQKEVLRLVLQQCRHTPPGILRLAMKSLDQELTVDAPGCRREFHMRTGQLMGSLLSFPLLCLINYIVFKYYVRRKVPLRINGDDIVARCTPGELNKWKEGVERFGLTLSEGKTIVDSTYFTLNSTMFASTESRVSLVPFIRSVALFPMKKGDEGVSSLRGRFYSFSPGFSGSRKVLVRTEFLRQNRSLLDRSGRSLSRGLGIFPGRASLIDAGIWDREMWYLSLPVEKPLPPPRAEWAVKPDGYTYECRTRKTKEVKGLREAFVNASWEAPRVGVNGEWRELMRGVDWGSWLYHRQRDLVRRSRLLGLSPVATRRYLRPRGVLPAPARRYYAWVPESGRGLTFHSQFGNRLDIHYKCRDRGSVRNDN